jgi:hypothetical protein
MSIERIKLFGLLALAFFLAAQASGQDFNQRVAAWQGRGVAMQRPAPPPIASTMPEPEVGGVEDIPGSSPSGQQKILSNVYNAPLHTPNYNNPWTNSPCASCYHNPTFEPASDPLGTCQFAGGGPLAGTMVGGCDGEACGGCGNCGQCGGAGGGCDWGALCSNPIVWARFEVLMWWRQGHDLPPMVTTDPATESSTTAGILPDATTLFGGGRMGSNMQAGGRADVGFFTNPTQTVGFGDRVFGLGRDSVTFNANQGNFPVLAVPFFDFAAGTNEALLVAYPGLRNGNVNVLAQSSLFSNDVYGRFLLCRDCNHRLDFITGWNYTRLWDDVQINTRSVETASGGTIAQGTVTQINNRFTASNNFNGGILGLQWQRNCGCWTTQALARISIGGMNETMNIAGRTRTAVPGQTAVTTQGGLFTAGSNIGQFSRTEFTAITELGYNVGYRFSPCTQLVFGYSFLYFNDILAAGRGIDTSVGTLGNATRPQFTFHHSDFWVQGINLGLMREF